MKQNTLPYSVGAYGATIARFNNSDDAMQFALAQSAKYPNGWKEVRDSKNILFAAYENGKPCFPK